MGSSILVLLATISRGILPLLCIEVDAVPEGQYQRAGLSYPALKKEDTMRVIGRPTAVMALVASGIVFTAGGAYAYRTAIGAGVGTVSVAAVEPLVIEQTPVNDLALGGPADLTGKVTNPNDFEASLLATVITVKVTADADHPGCDIKNFAVKAPSTKAELIEAKGSIELDKGSITLLNTTLDQAACHGATLTLKYQLTRAPSSPATAVAAVPTASPSSAGSGTATTGPTVCPSPSVASGTTTAAGPATSAAPPTAAAPTTDAPTTQVP
jgi:hypothetical protein